MKWNSCRLLYSLKESVLLNEWDKKRQCLRSNNTSSKDGMYFINDLISNVKSIAIMAYRKESVNGVPTINQIRKHLDDFFLLNQRIQEEEIGKPTLYGLIDRFIKGEILYKGRKKSVSTIQCYSTTLKHLKEFEKKEKYPINFDTITLEFFYKFVGFLRNKGLQQNSLNKNIGVIKVFLSEAVDLGYTNSIDFKKKKFSIGQVLVETIYLKDSELKLLHKYDASKTPSLENVKDAFLIACYTGLRFSDFSTLSLQNIQEIDGEKFIRKTTLKTGEEVIIPINSIVQEILDKYKNTLRGTPKTGCNVVFNKMIKIVCKGAGLIEKGRLASDWDKELFACISSHTGRRTFATNAYLSGMGVLDIMRMTGHASEKNFMRYIRLSKLDAARRYSSHLTKIDLSKQTLRAV